MTPILAMYPVEKTSAFSRPVKAASSSSRASCSWLWPVTRWDAPLPTPYFMTAFAKAWTTSG